MATRTLEDVVQLVRASIRDYPQLNRLIEGEESGDGMIKLAISSVIDQWNTSPPFIGTALVSNFPSESLLVIGAIVNLWDQVIALGIRNYSSLRDAGGVSDVDGANAPLLQQEAARRRQIFEQRLATLKKAININAAFGQGGLHSEYY